jgi:hypothetical protein
MCTIELMTHFRHHRNLSLICRVSRFLFKFATINDNTLLVNQISFVNLFLIFNKNLSVLFYHFAFYPKQYSTITQYIKAAKSFFNAPREKLSPRPLAAEARQSQGCLRDFAAKVTDDLGEPTRSCCPGWGPEKSRSFDFFSLRSKNEKGLAFLSRSKTHKGPNASFY